jgi:hypothetical protein
MYVDSPRSSPFSTGQLLALCPLCRTAHPEFTPEDVSAGAEWRCATCHQYWGLARLRTVAAYDEWQRARATAAQSAAGRRDRLVEVIAAVDRRVRHPARPTEAAIATDAAAVRLEAERQLALLTTQRAAGAASRSR